MPVTTRIEMRKSASGPISMVTVGDSQHPKLVGTFTYNWTGNTFTLAGIAVGPVHDLPQDEVVPLSVTLVRDLPMARWQQAAWAALVDRFVTDFRLRTVIWLDSDEGEPPNLAPTARPGKIGRLAAVAQAYRANVAAGQPDPVAAIARDHGVNPNTARSWIFRARKAGLLGPAPGRTAGERNPWK